MFACQSSSGGVLGPAGSGEGRTEAPGEEDGAPPVSKRKAAPEIDATLRTVLSSPEYLAAVKERAIAGRITATEANLLRSLGVAVPVLDQDTAARENLRKLPREVLAVLADANRLALSPQNTRLRLIRAGSIVGVGYDTSTDPIPVYPIPPPSATVPQTDDELLPPKVTV